MSKITEATFIKQSGMDERLANSTINQCGGWTAFKEIAEDVANHGADAGFAGFVYYTDTVAFTRRNKWSILKFAKQFADELGEVSVWDMVGGFNCLKITPDQAAEGFYDGESECHEQVYNALAWFVLEELSRRYVYILE